MLRPHTTDEPQRSEQGPSAAHERGLGNHGPRYASGHKLGSAGRQTGTSKHRRHTLETALSPNVTRHRVGISGLGRWHRVRHPRFHGATLRETQQFQAREHARCHQWRRSAPSRGQNVGAKFKTFAALFGIRLEAPRHHTAEQRSVRPRDCVNAFPAKFSAPCTLSSRAQQRRLAATPESLVSAAPLIPSQCASSNNSISGGCSRTTT